MAGSEAAEIDPRTVVDFSNTEIAFAHKSNGDLRRTSWLFRLMNKDWLVRTGSSVALWFHGRNIHLLNPVFKSTIFKQFVGGTDLQDAAKAATFLWKHQVQTILDFGAEGKEDESDFDFTLQENIRSIQFAAKAGSVPVVSSKLTALCSSRLFEKYQLGQPFTAEEQQSFDRGFQRVDTLCRTALEYGIAVYVDAEETWIQDTIDEWVKSMMERYNRERAVVYHTYQLYRKDKLASLMADYHEAREKDYILGAKIVRGAYMEKERERAVIMQYPSPIQDTLEDTHRDYNNAVRFCVEHYTDLASCTASHNMESNLLQARLIVEQGIDRRHPHLFFCQLYGMSDFITFNLAKAGFNVAKYMPYGPVKDVIPYLIRRAMENTAVTGEMSRELEQIVTEMQRRGMSVKSTYRKHAE